MSGATIWIARITILTGIALSDGFHAGPGFARTVAPSVYPTVKADRRPATGIVLRHLQSDPEQRYFLYVPPRGAISRPVLVTVHGVSRNAEEHARRFKRLAKRYGVALVAPLFPEDRFPDYQRLGQSGKGERPDRALQAILGEVGDLTGADVARVYLFGYSGGGQFAHRYAMAYPEQVARVAVGAAGWYTFPDPAAYGSTRKRFSKYRWRRSSASAMSGAVPSAPR